MRLLITLMTVLASAFAAVCASGATVAADPPCLPRKQDTAWGWPLGGPWVRAGPTILRPF